MSLFQPGSAFANFGAMTSDPSAYRPDEWDEMMRNGWTPTPPEPVGGGLGAMMGQAVAPADEFPYVDPSAWLAQQAPPAYAAPLQGSQASAAAANPYVTPPSVAPPPPAIFNPFTAGLPSTPIPQIAPEALAAQQQADALRKWQNEVSAFDEAAATQQREGGAPALLDQLRGQRTAEGTYGGTGAGWLRAAALAGGAIGLGALSPTLAASGTVKGLLASAAIPHIPGYESLPEPLQIAARNAPFAATAFGGYGLSGAARLAGLGGSVVGGTVAPGLGLPEWAGEAIGGGIGTAAPAVGKYAVKGAELAAPGLRRLAVEEAGGVRLPGGGGADDAARQAAAGGIEVGDWVRTPEGVRGQVVGEGVLGKEPAWVIDAGDGRTTPVVKGGASLWAKGETPLSGAPQRGDITAAQAARSANLAAAAQAKYAAELAEGWTPRAVSVNDVAGQAAIKREFDRLKGTYPMGNPTHPDTIRYNELKTQMQGGATKQDYRLYSPDGNRLKRLTKTEYNALTTMQESAPNLKGTVETPLSGAGSAPGTGQGVAAGGGGPPPPRAAAAPATGDALAEVKIEFPGARGVPDGDVFLSREEWVSRQPDGQWLYRNTDMPQLEGRGASALDAIHDARQRYYDRGTVSNTAPAPPRELPPGTGGAGEIPPAQPPTAVGGELPPAIPSDPVAKLSSMVKVARELPAETEALRSQARRQRVAIGASQLEAGGRTPEAFRAARAAQAGEMPRAGFELPKDVTFAPEEAQHLRNMIGGSNLRFYEQINTEGALQKILDGRLNEITPSEITLIDSVWGKELAETIVEKAPQFKPSFWDYAMEYRYFNMLSGPFTQARNFIGNSGAALMGPVERLGSAAIETPLAKLQGRAAERFFAEVPASVAGGIKGIPDGLRGALNIIKQGYDPSKAGKIEYRTRAFKGLPGTIIRAPSTLMEAMDSFFYGMNYRSSLYGNAVREAKMAGLKGNDYLDGVARRLTEPSEALTEMSAKEAEMRLFRGDPGEFAKSLMEFRDKSPAVQLLIPFLRTPANLIRFGMRRSPLGLMDVQSWRKALAGNPEGVDEIARGVIGSGIVASVAALVATGQIEITASAPGNSSERDRFYREGKLPFSIKVPGVGWVQYRQIEPLNVPLTMVASAIETIKNGGSPEDIAAGAGLMIASNLSDQSYMTGIADAMEAIQDPERNAAWWAQRQVTSFLPANALSRQVTTAIDPTFRDPENLLETVKSGTPGLSGQVPARLTAFGEEASRGLPSPIQVRAPSQSDVDKVLDELGVEVGFVGDSIGGQKLSREQQRLYQEVAGKLVYMDLVDLIAADAWAQADNAEKQELIEKIVNSGRADVRKAFSAVLAKEAPP